MCKLSQNVEYVQLSKCDSLAQTFPRNVQICKLGHKTRAQWKAAEEDVLRKCKPESWCLMVVQCAMCYMQYKRATASTTTSNTELDSGGHNMAHGAI